MVIQRDCRGRAFCDFTFEEKERIKEILEELKIMFDAQSVGLSQELNNQMKCDFTIKLYNCTNPSYNNY